MYNKNKCILTIAMGIKHLNNYLQTLCPSSISKISLSELSGKKIVIDTSIYLYRFIGDGGLLENFYLMISIFRQYNIIPLFVFDGKPPKEKGDTLKQRNIEKKEAEYKYNVLEERLNDSNTSDEEKIEIRDRMEMLKRNFVRVHHTDIENVKALIQSYGVSYIDAPGEADKLCAKFVCKNKAYACLSEDMDLFVYGCNRVMRYLSLLNKTVVMYDLPGILDEIKLSLLEFQSICIVSGTDYNNNSTSKNNLHQTLKYFKKYKKDGNVSDFYEWLNANTNYVSNVYELYNVLEMFNLSNMIEYKPYDKLKIMNGPINKSNLINIMKKEHFVFAD
jgi:5'-3' exonuclease